MSTLIIIGSNKIIPIDSSTMSSMIYFDTIIFHHWKPITTQLWIQIVFQLIRQQCLP
jgi:hypothetical protein